VYEFFRESVRVREYDNAYEVLSRETKRDVSYDEFFLVFSNFFVLRRIIIEAKVELRDSGEERAVLKFTNPEFGIDKNLLVVFHRLGKTGLWEIDIPHNDLVELVEKGRKWYKYQLAKLGERKYSLPAWWRFR